MDTLRLDSTAFVELLGKLIAVAGQVQNAPSLGLIPQENLVSDLVLDHLHPYLKANNGLSAERLEFTPGRGHLILRYLHPSIVNRKTTPTVAFVGSHFDVVPASAEGWTRDPFKLLVEGDKLYGRGTTDCLGNVALLTLFFVELAKIQPMLTTEVVAVMIASEENTEIAGIGVETLMSAGKIDFIKNGPVIWLDGADTHPCIGTAGVATWSLMATGKEFHSGLPNMGINAIELAMDAMTYIQKRFYQDFKERPQEKEYKFTCPSTMKPTRVESSPSGLNQVPAWAVLSGDIRLSPFYEMQDAMTKVQGYVDDLNHDIRRLEGLHGSESKYALEEEKVKGTIEFTFDPTYFEGIACSLDSVGFKALSHATKKIIGDVQPFSLSGSLPLIRDLQRQGLDLVVAGFGRLSVAHCDNEYCLLSEMVDGFRILALTVEDVDNLLNDNNSTSCP